MLCNNEVFHVHTWRCGHAESVQDDVYIKRALELGANQIVFTDHAPFPENPFGNRMRMEQLLEYITTLRQFKMQYKNDIDVVVGLEIEYLPKYHSYIEELYRNDNIEFLLLGQHLYEDKNGLWSFQHLDKDNGWQYLLEAQMEAMTTGFFNGVAHPDRVFRQCGVWDDKMAAVSEKFIDFAIRANRIPLEKNISSYLYSVQHTEYSSYRPEFWNMLPDDYPILVGCDAHGVGEICLSDEKYVITSPKRTTMHLF